MEESTRQHLRRAFPQVGRLEWIGVAPARRAPLESLQSARVRVGSGLDGDHHAMDGGRQKRQVTLIQAEHLGPIGALVGAGEPVDPRKTRRNLVVSGVNLASLVDRRFRVGEVVLEGTKPCDPCELMEEKLGAGGYNAMWGHGGLCTRVLEGGTIQIGDRVEVLAPAEEA